MKVTQGMVDAFYGEPPGTGAQADPMTLARLQAVLDLIDVEEFRFAGYPDNQVYIHPACGTVVDVVPGRSDMRYAVAAGECDCENNGSWVRIFVQRSGEQ